MQRLGSIDRGQGPDQDSFTQLGARGCQAHQERKGERSKVGNRHAQKRKRDCIRKLTQRHIPGFEPSDTEPTAKEADHEHDKHSRNYEVGQALFDLAFYWPREHRHLFLISTNDETLDVPL